jgi:predicted AAA+ superfamily ATPase
MERTAMAQLQEWKARKNRKPLIIRGARQTGKTWLMKEFGRIAYGNTVYINFDNNRIMRDLFAEDVDTARLIRGLELYSGQKIESDKTLLIFDEIQEVPQALTALKYFHENVREYHIVCAGSLLGVALHAGTNFPVGKVEFLDLYPLSFPEFLKATGNERFEETLARTDFDMVTSFKTTYIDLLKQYYFVGGMPEVVAAFSERQDFGEARELQQSILTAYEQDFSKHAPHETVPRIRMLWNSIPAQLARENKKFMYGLIKEGSRAREYELAMQWLCDCGLVHKVHRVTAPSLPLKAYEDLKAFKLFVLDVGLLSCLTGLAPQTLLDGNELFREFKGALTEQYVLQQLVTLKNITPWYWSNDRNSAEIDFLIDTGTDVVPIEVKAEINLQAKSLKTYREQFSPRIAVRTAMTDYKREEGLINLPLYAIHMIREATATTQVSQRQ